MSHGIHYHIGGPVVFIVIVIHRCFLLFLLIWALQSPTRRNSLL